MPQPMTSCILGGYTFPYNPPDLTNPVVRAISETQTLLGRVFTDFGTDPSRRDITLKWDAMEAEFYFALQGKILTPGDMPYVDEYGAHWTVLPATLTYDKFTPGGDGVLNVVLKLIVVSKP